MSLPYPKVFPPVSPKELEDLNLLRNMVADNAKDKGFRDVLRDSMTEEQWNGTLGKMVRAAVFTANLHGEASEFWEAFRAGKLEQPCDKAEKMKELGLPPLTCAAEEIADVIIRTLDQAEAYGVDVAEAVAVKMSFNSTREHLHGNKKA
jgi:NTP pyrophosphatase (non-canonical NTP hydrolase)